MTAEEIARALKGKKSGRGWKACCPAHDDKNPSFSVWDGEKGEAAFHCFAECSQEAIKSALEDRGLWNSNQKKKATSMNCWRGCGYDFNKAKRQQTKTQPEPEDDTWGQWQDVSPPYAYTDADGKLLYQVVRTERFSAAGDKQKKFPQRRPDGKGGWEWKQGEQRVLYRWPELLKFPDATAFITEGEKTRIDSPR